MDVPGDEHMGGHLYRGPFDVFSIQTFLDSFIPGYGPIYKVVTDTLGYDTTTVICLGVAFWLLARISRPVWVAIGRFLRNYYRSEISVSSEDDIFDHLISLFARQDETHHRKLIAETTWKSTWEIGSGQAGSLELTDEANPWLNFSNEGLMSQPQFTPGTGLHKVWHKGTCFELGRKEKTVLDTTGDGGFTLGDTQRLTLSCWGRSPDPIKELIQYAKAQYYLQYSAKTVVKHPALRDMQRFNKSCWTTVAERPCRPIENVVLDEDRKTELLHDINEYLSPATARWYAKRGIPYRRGYLFHGPPGTGKTSLTFAIAGVFGLEIYAISLLEPNLTEEDLRTLFNNLPARCVVLLEDIDTAGLLRDVGEDSPQQALHNTAVNNELNATIWASTLKKISGEKRPGISLSSLLNIIDGVASHEGRVLVMTTNHLDKLDEALIRPGRIDFEVAFSNATNIQVRELFERMYANDSVPSISGHSALNNMVVNGVGEEVVNGVGEEVVNGVGEEVKNTCLAPEELSVVASEFAKQVPGDIFSPAEIQGFLIKRKKDHRKAIEDVGAWVKETLAKKKSRSKLVQ